MAKILFTPFSIVSGIVAGVLGARLFDTLWNLVDGQQPPDPKHRDVSWKKALAALALQGAIFSAVRGLVDRGSRKTFEHLTGAWPGKRAPDLEA